MPLTLVSEAVVREVISLELAFTAVSDALKAVAAGQADIMPVVMGDAEGPGAMFGVKTATNLSAGLLGLKVGSYFPANHARGIPNHGSTTLLLNADTGLPHALVSAGYLNGFRTAAANAVAEEPNMMGSYSAAVIKTSKSSHSKLPSKFMVSNLEASSP